MYVMSSKKKKKEKFLEYEDPIGGFSNRDLLLARWYVQHRERLRAIFVIIFFIVDAILIGYGFWGWSTYAIFGYKQDQYMLSMQIAEIEDYASQRARYSARDLQFATPEIYKSEYNRFDFVIDVQNSNERWVAQITYQFFYNGGVTEQRTLYIMPGVRQPLAVLGVNSSVTPSGVRFQPIDIRWTRINSHMIRDIVDYMSKRNNFVISDVTFVYATEDDTGGNQIIFDITNNSVFNFWYPQFLVELRDGDKREGLILVSIDEFMAGQTEYVKFQSFVEDIYVSGAVLHPVINFFDDNEYKY